MQVLAGIVGGTKALDILLFQEVPYGKIRGGEPAVAAVPDFFAGTRGKGQCDVKIALQLQVRPMVKRVADSPFYGFRPGTEAPVILFFAFGRGQLTAGTGDEFFRESGCAHRPPFIVVAVKPRPGDVGKADVVIDFPGAEVVVVIKDRHLFCVRVIKRAGCLIGQKEILVHEGFHGLFSYPGYPRYFFRVCSTAPLPAQSWRK